MIAKLRAIKTNLVLLLNNNELDVRKFIVWNIEEKQPVEVLQNLQITKISIENQKKMFEHPLEDGSTIVDYSIIEAKKASITAYISNDDAESLSELERLYLNGTKLRIRAENKIIENMVVASQPFEISGEIFDKNLYTITLKEAQFVMPQYVEMPKAKKKANTSRVQTGVKQAKEVKKPASWLYSLFFGGRT